VVGSRRRGTPARKPARRRIFFAALALGLLLAAGASAHIERASYWPDPAPDRSVSPPAGGRVPEIRPLGTALIRGLPGQTRVVCQRGSLPRLVHSVIAARRHGYNIRPFDHRRLSRFEAARLIAINVALWRHCGYHEIQPAVTASGNNDRVVVMPGIYTEPTSRSKPTNDPACDQYEIRNDRNEAGAVSYAYQFHCPNDQNLIAVIGHSLGTGTDPQPPREDRHGIPNLGRCIRCNFQIEGSGVSSDDVVVDAGNPARGNDGPAVGAKDVGIRADRADGFVLRKMNVRHVNEHGIYVLESDGYVLDRFKTFQAGEYGLLTFVEDHGLIENCEAASSGDSGLYPGGGADTGAQRDPRYYPQFRYSQEMRNCDMHHNALGYSGTDGNAVWVHDNNFYDNAMGLSTDVFTAPGHPGFPQDSDLIERNNFFSNNFNPYLPGSDVVPTVPVPVGTGLWIAGGNDNVIRNNRFWNNWRRGTMIFAVPDAFVCDDPQVQVPGCDPAKTSTSYRNSTHDNIMGIAPNGAHLPNGQDFWWSDWPGTTGNCWYHNASYRPITTHPSPLPNCNNGQNPALSVGDGDAEATSELLGCLTAIDNPDPNNPACSWFRTPPRPTP
jgi:Right handed beta helix region